MEVFRFRGALLRQPSPLLPFLAPTASRLGVARQFRSQYLPSALSLPASRSLVTTSRRRAEEKRAAGSAPSSGGRQETDELSRIMDSSFKPTRRPRTNNAFENDGPRQGGNSVSDMMLSAIGPLGRNRSKIETSPLGLSDFNVEQMLNPSSASSSLGSRLPPAIPDAPLPFKLGPSVGRMVTVDPVRNMDVGRAFRQLEIVCNRNRVRSDFTKQRFHERPGLKRKRLKSSRWRLKFKEGFRGIVKKVMLMKKQGW